MRDIHNSHLLLLFFSVLFNDAFNSSGLYGFMLDNEMQTMVQEAALGNLRKYRVIWLGKLSKTTRLQQDNLFRD